MTQNRKTTSLLVLSAIPAVMLAALFLNKKIPAPESVPAVVAANAH